MANIIVPGALTKNVQLYGAKGDGVTDDTAAIQSAINAAGSGGTVWIPFTTSGYLCSQLTLPSGVRLHFDRGAFLTAPSTLAASWLLADAVVHQGTQVIGGTFIATATTSASVTAVIDFSAATSCPDVRIEGNRIVNAPVHAIYLAEGTLTHDGKWIEDNSIEGIGDLVNGASFATIQGNTLTGSTPGSSSAGISNSGSYCLIRSNHVEVTVGNGIALSGSCHYNVISGNTVTTTSATNSGSALSDAAGCTRSIWEDNILGDPSYAGAFTYAMQPGGNQNIFAGNLCNGGCYDGVDNQGTGNSFIGNAVDVVNSPIATYGDSTSSFHNNPQINPIGVVTVAVPASGTAVAAVAYDRTFYVTDSSTGTTVAVGGTQVAAIAAGAAVPVFVPAGQTMTATYTTAPTWVCYAN